MSLKLIASDLDGTLLTNGKTLTQRTRELLISAMEQGISFVPVTGRAFSSVPKSVLELPGVEYIITSNGAAIYSISRRERIYSCLLTPEAVDAVLDFRKRIIAKDFAMEGFIEGVPYAEAKYFRAPRLIGATVIGSEYVKKTRIPKENLDGFLRENRNQIDSLSFICASPALLEECKNYMEERIPGLLLIPYLSHLLEIGHENSGKGKTLTHLLDKLQISADEVLAFGDAQNDVDLLRSVKYGIAMGNAAAECKKAAFRITKTNEEEGVAAVLERCLSEKDFWETCLTESTQDDRIKTI